MKYTSVMKMIIIMVITVVVLVVAWFHENPAFAENISDSIGACLQVSFLRLGQLVSGQLMHAAGSENTGHGHVDVLVGAMTATLQYKKS